MGYRLEISELKNPYSAGKLYGYVDEKKLKSYKWLLDNGYIDEDDIWDYSFSHDIVLYSDDFIEFIKLYNEDLNDLNFQFKDQLINDEKMQELMKSKEYKILQWF